MSRFSYGLYLTISFLGKSSNALINHGLGGRAPKIGSTDFMIKLEHFYVDSWPMGRPCLWPSVCVFLFSHFLILMFEMLLLMVLMWLNPIDVGFGCNRFFFFFLLFAEWTECTSRRVVWQNTHFLRFFSCHNRPVMRHFIKIVDNWTIEWGGGEHYCKVNLNVLAGIHIQFRFHFLVY